MIGRVSKKFVEIVIASKISSRSDTSLFLSVFICPSMSVFFLSPSYSDFGARAIRWIFMQYGNWTERVGSLRKGIDTMWGFEYTRLISELRAIISSCFRHTHYL